MKKLLKKVAAIGVNVVNVILLALLRLLYVVILSGTFILTVGLVLAAGNRVGVKYMHEVSGDIMKGFAREK